MTLPNPFPAQVTELCLYAQYIQETASQIVFERIAAEQERIRTMQGLADHLAKVDADIHASRTVPTATTLTAIAATDSAAEDLQTSQGDQTGACQADSTVLTALAANGVGSLTQSEFKTQSGSKNSTQAYGNSQQAACISNLLSLLGGINASTLLTTISSITSTCESLLNSVGTHSTILLSMQNQDNALNSDYCGF